MTDANVDSSPGEGPLAPGQQPQAPGVLPTVPGSHPTRRANPRLTPERVRSTGFTRTPLGRRGVHEEEVQAFVQRVAEDIAARDAAEAALRAEVGFYKDRLLQWQTDQRDPGAPPQAPRPAKPTVEAINILSKAQQEADAYVAQAQEYCRRVTDDAREHAEAILGEARQEAEEAAEQAAQEYRVRAGAGYAPESEELERRIAWSRAFLSSLETVETQLRTAREALAYEFDQLSSTRAAAAAE